MPVHNKLVRDKIPEIIENTGKSAYCHILAEEEYIAELDKKLNEECAEYQADKSLEVQRPIAQKIPRGLCSFLV